MHVEYEVRHDVDFFLGFLLTLSFISRSYYISYSEEEEDAGRALTTICPMHRMPKMAIMVLIETGDIVLIFFFFFFFFFFFLSRKGRDGRK